MCLLHGAIPCAMLIYYFILPLFLSKLININRVLLILIGIGATDLDSFSNFLYVSWSKDMFLYLVKSVIIKMAYFHQPLHFQEQEVVQQY